MKTALILTANKWFSPYYNIYADYLKSNGVPYDVISWNRDLSEESTPLSYSVRIKSDGWFIKLFSYARYACFVRRVVRKNHYRNLIVFGSQLSVFLIPLLLFSYRRKYIIDFRDLSIEQYPVIKTLFSCVLRESYCNVVSSSGFIKYLPKADYIVAHNLNMDLARKGLDITYKPPRRPYEVLTIGGIRDYESNMEVVKSLANSSIYNIKFVGKGYASKKIEESCLLNSYTNVSFSGYYKKEDEPEIIKSSSVLNIFYPQIKSHMSAMSNRFYNSLIYKKPMIVTAGSIQGEYVEKYNLGVSVKDCSDLANMLCSFIVTMDKELFENNCNILLAGFIKDNELFLAELDKFIHDNN